jgi:hypothetical protein
MGSRHHRRCGGGEVITVWYDLEYDRIWVKDPEVDGCFTVHYDYKNGHEWWCIDSIPLKFILIGDL